MNPTAPGHCVRISARRRLPLRPFTTLGRDPAPVASTRSSRCHGSREDPRSRCQESGRRSRHQQPQDSDRHGDSPCAAADFLVRRTMGRRLVPRLRNMGRVVRRTRSSCSSAAIPGQCPAPQMVHAKRDREVPVDSTSAYGSELQHVHSKGRWLRISHRRAVNFPPPRFCVRHPEGISTPPRTTSHMISRAWTGRCRSPGETAQLTVPTLKVSDPLRKTAAQRCFSRGWGILPLSGSICERLTSHRPHHGDRFRVATIHSPPSLPCTARVPTGARFGSHRGPARHD